MKFDQVEQNKEVQRWFSDGGDYELRLDYNLDDESVVFDLGGYQGWFAEISIKNLNLRFMFLNHLFHFIGVWIKSLERTLISNYLIMDFLMLMLI